MVLMATVNATRDVRQMSPLDRGLLTAYNQGIMLGISGGVLDKYTYTGVLY